MKLLITDNTIVNHGDDRGGVDAAQGDIVDVNKDTARALVAPGRALYTNKADDPEKGAPNTAPAELLKAAQAAIADKAKAAAAGAKPAE